MNNQFVLLHDADKNCAEVWVNLSLVMTVYKDSNDRHVTLMFSGGSILHVCEPLDSVVPKTHRTGDPS